MAATPPEPYVLVIPATVLAAVREWSRSPIGSRYRAQTAQALKLARENLTQQPLEWGDPLRNLSSGRIVECHRSCRPLHFTYRVDLQKRVVVVHSIIPIPETSKPSGS